MKLSPNFTLEEFLRSETAARHGIYNFPPQACIPNLRRVAKVLELVRGLLGNEPIFINSGYRNEELNRLVKGSKNSAHMQGLAADIVMKGKKPLAIAQLISNSTLVYDQLIVEFGQWVHVGLAPLQTPLRRQDLHVVYGSGFKEGLK